MPRWTHEASIIINYMQFLICIAIITKIVLLLSYHKHFRIGFMTRGGEEREGSPLTLSHILIGHAMRIDKLE